MSSAANSASSAAEADSQFSSAELLDFLSPESRAALKLHFDSKEREAALVKEINECASAVDPAALLSENFGMSQFWYSDETSDSLALESLSLGGRLAPDDFYTPRRIACLSCPSVFKSLHRMLSLDPRYSPAVAISLFEFDRRFSVYGEQFHYFDYNSPTEFDESLKHAFDFVIADPPYLSEGCMKKTGIAMKWLGKSKETKFLFNTGAILTDSIELYLDLRPLREKPKHSCQLMNEFRSFANYDSKRLGGFEVEEAK